MDSEDDEILRQLLGSVDALFSRAGDRTGDAEFWPDLVELGVPGMLLPEALGGAGLTLLQASSVMEAIGARCTETPLLAGSLVPSVALAALPHRPSVALLAAEIAVGKATYPLAWQAFPGQVDVSATAATLDGGRITGAKFLVPDSADGFIASVSDGSSELMLALIARGDPGLHVSTMPLVDGSAALSLRFLEIETGEDRLLAGGDGAKEALSAAIAAGAVLRAAQLCGLARRSLEATLAFLQQRQQFGRKLSEFQALQHRAVELYAQTRLARASWRAAARFMHNDPTSTATQVAVSAAKARCGDVANLLAKQAIQMHGAFGFTEDAGLGRILNAALAWSASFGTSQAHRRRFHHLSSQDAAA